MSELLRTPAELSKHEYAALICDELQRSRLTPEEYCITLERRYRKLGSALFMAGKKFSQAVLLGDEESDLTTYRHATNFGGIMAFRVIRSALPVAASLMPVKADLTSVEISDEMMVYIIQRQMEIASEVYLRHSGVHALIPRWFSRDKISGVAVGYGHTMWLAEKLWNDQPDIEQLALMSGIDDALDWDNALRREINL